MTTKIVTFGESLLRLSPPSYERFLQSPNFTATFGGAEANVAVALTSFGLKTTYVTVLPEHNPIADAVVAEMRRFGVDTSQIVRGKGRLGIYYLERGADQRASWVVYDRDHSALALAQPGDIRWDNAFDGAAWFHITGITPALSSTAAVLALESMNKARTMGLTVSFDLNYRRELWNWGKSAREVMGKMIGVTDILIGNEEHLRMVLGLNGTTQIRDLADKVLSTYDNVKAVAVSLRESNASQLLWSAYLCDREGLFASRQYDVTRTVDRVGAGDAFAAGLIYGWIHLGGRQEALDFATAAGCLKHTIIGDFCRATTEEVTALLRNEKAGRIRR